MKKLTVKLNDTTFKYAQISFITGILIFIYSNLIFNYVEDKNLGERFKSNNFFESDLFIIVGACQVFIGILYILIYFNGKFYLINKFTIRVYWYTLPIILTFLMVPVLDRYYPTSKYGDTLLTKIIDYYFIFSVFLFFVGIYYFINNFLKSIFAYFKIRKGWKK